MRTTKLQTEHLEGAECQPLSCQRSEVTQLINLHANVMDYYFNPKPELRRWLSCPKRGRAFRKPLDDKKTINIMRYGRTTLAPDEWTKFPCTGDLDHQNIPESEFCVWKCIIFSPPALVLFRQVAEGQRAKRQYWRNGLGRIQKA